MASAPAPFITKGQRREMAYNGPMRSGLVIDSRALLVKGYENYQMELLAKLNPAGSGQWYAPHMQNRGNRMQIDVDTRRGRTIIPGYFIARGIAGEALASLLAQKGLPARLDSPDKAATFHISAIDLRLYDMGYGSVTFAGELEAHGDMSVEEYRDAAEKIGSALADFRPLFISTFEQVSAEVSTEFVALSFHGLRPTNAYWRNSHLGQNIGDLFWVHRLFSIECQNHQQFLRKKDLCKRLVVSEAAETLEDMSIDPHMAIYPGNGNSAVIFEKGKPKPQDINTLTSMVRAQNIFYVAAEDIDRDMFYLSNELDRQKHSKNMSLLEKQSEVIVDYQSKVTFFKAIYDDFDNSLDPQGLKVWHALEKSWATRDRFTNMNTKLELVEKIYNRIRENLNHLQNKRIGTFMLAFTLISTLSVIVDTVDFTQGADLKYPSIIRIAVLVMLLLVVIFFAVGVMRGGKRRV
ncbi:MAG: hypothetical protein ACAH80_10595 [Alphaproteobacteria bacterium]